MSVKRSRIVWKSDEIEQLCKRWVQKDGAHLTVKTLQAIAKEDGYGYRPRKLPTHVAREFFDENREAALAAWEEKVDQPMTEPIEVVPSPPPPPRTLEDAVRGIVREEIALAIQNIRLEFANMLADIPRVETVENKPSYKRVVILMGNTAQYFSSLREAFPWIEFFVSNEIPTMNCHLVIGQSILDTDPTVRKLRLKYGNRYCGGITTLEQARGVITRRMGT